MFRMLGNVQIKKCVTGEFVSIDYWHVGSLLFINGKENGGGMLIGMGSSMFVMKAINVY